MDTQERIKEMLGRTGRDLNKTLRRLLSPSPETPVAFQLANYCKVEWCKKPLNWIRGSSVCSCDNGHIHDYKSGEYLAGV